MTDKGAGGEDITDIFTSPELVIRMVRGTCFTYTVPGLSPFIWSVDAAMREVEAGNVAVTVPVDHANMVACRQNNEWDPAKIDLVDPTVPGIGAPMQLGAMQGFYVMIDGTHRCVRALRDGLPFLVRLLTPEAARRCVISEPTPDARHAWVEPV